MAYGNDKLSSDGIFKYLDHNSREKYNIRILGSVDSTNTLLKEMAARGESAGKVVIAESQLSGKGRMGRNFYSPYGAGLYMSVLIRPDMELLDSQLITACTAAAAAKAIETVSGTEAGIKWANDIYCRGKKVCGILTETASGAENGKMGYAVVGIGVNISEPEKGFPEELKNIAGTIFKREEYPPEAGNRLAAEILNNLNKYYENIYSEKYIEEYRKRSILNGKKVIIVHASRDGNDKEQAEVLGIDDKAGLIVKLGNGEVKTLISGEVSIIQ